MKLKRVRIHRVCWRVRWLMRFLKSKVLSPLFLLPDTLNLYPVLSGDYNEVCAGLALKPSVPPCLVNLKPFDSDIPEEHPVLMIG